MDTPSPALNPQNSNHSDHSQCSGNRGDNEPGNVSLGENDQSHRHCQIPQDHESTPDAVAEHKVAVRSTMKTVNGNRSETQFC